MMPKKFSIPGFQCLDTLIQNMEEARYSKIYII